MGGWYGGLITLGIDLADMIFHISLHSLTKLGEVQRSLFNLWTTNHQQPSKVWNLVQIHGSRLCFVYLVTFNISNKSHTISYIWYICTLLHRISYDIHYMVYLYVSLPRAINWRTLKHDLHFQVKMLNYLPNCYHHRLWIAGTNHHKINHY